MFDGILVCVFMVMVSQYCFLDILLLKTFGSWDLEHYHNLKCFQFSYRTKWQYKERIWRTGPLTNGVCCGGVNNVWSRLAAWHQATSHIFQIIQFY